MRDNQTDISGDITAEIRASTAMEDEWARPALDALRSEIRKSKRVLVAVFLPLSLAMPLLILIFGEPDWVVYSIGGLVGTVGLAGCVGLLREGAESRLLELVPTSNKVMCVRIPVEQAWHITPPAEQAWRKTPEQRDYTIVLIRTPSGRHLSIGGEGYLANGTAAGGVFPGQVLSFAHYFLDRTTKKVPPMIEGIQSMQLAIYTEGVARPLAPLGYEEMPAECLEFGYSPSGFVSTENGCAFIMSNTRLGYLTQEEILGHFSLSEVQAERG